MKATMVQAINMAIAQEMERDKDIVMIGEDIGIDGGVFRVTEGLYEKFGIDRVIDSPLSESGIVGTALGMAIAGLRPIVEIQFQGFDYNAYHHINQHAAKLRNRTRGMMNVPMVIRLPYSGGIKALEHHSDSQETIYIHIPGIKVVCPSSPYEAKGLLASSLVDNDTVMFFEPKRLYRAFKEEVPEDRYEIPIGKAKILNEGKDITLISWGAMTYVSKEAVQKSIEKNISVEHIDLRSLHPCDWETINNSVSKTGRAIIVHEANKTLGFGAEISARIMEKNFLNLLAPVKRITGWDIPIPLPTYEDFFYPNPDRILKGIIETMEY